MLKIIFKQLGRGAVLHFSTSTLINVDTLLYFALQTTLCVIKINSHCADLN